MPSLLAATCITPNPTQLPHALVSLSDTVYTISVATYYSFVGILLLLVLCCTIPSYPFCFSSFFPHSLFPFFCFPPSLPPLTHYSFPSFPPFNSTFPLILFSIPHLLIFPFPISLSVSLSSFNFSLSTITHFLHHSFLSHLDSMVTSSILQPSGL